MKIKVQEAKSTQLNYLVAKIEVLEVWEGETVDQTRYTTSVVPVAVYLCDDGEEYSPSTDWYQGGPIIERGKIATKFFEAEASWVADVKGGFFEQYGETPLLAAMRCFVASKIGEEVEVPNELCK